MGSVRPGPCSRLAPESFGSGDHSGSRVHRHPCVSPGGEDGGEEGGVFQPCIFESEALGFWNGGVEREEERSVIGGLAHARGLWRVCITRFEGEET